MKLQLIREQEEVIGWTIEAENEKEMCTLGSIRNMVFFGIDQRAIAYAGMQHYTPDERYVHKLAWIQKNNLNEFSFSKLDKNNTFAHRMSKER